MRGWPGLGTQGRDERGTLRAPPTHNGEVRHCAPRSMLAMRFFPPLRGAPPSPRYSIKRLPCFLNESAEVQELKPVVFRSFNVE